MNDTEQKLKDFIIIKLTLLTGACGRPAITKKQIKEALERAIKEIQEWGND